MEDGVNGALGVTVLPVVVWAVNPEVEHVPPRLNQDQEQIVLENPLQVKLVRWQLVLVRFCCYYNYQCEISRLIKHQYS